MHKINEISRFAAFSISSNVPLNLNSRVILAIDPTSSRLFEHPQLLVPVMELGGYRGHILVIDVGFESEDDNHGDVKGYNGQLRVINQFIDLCVPQCLCFITQSQVFMPV